MRKRANERKSRRRIYKRIETEFDINLFELWICFRESLSPSHSVPMAGCIVMFINTSETVAHAQLVDSFAYTHLCIPEILDHRFDVKPNDSSSRTNRTMLSTAPLSSAASEARELTNNDNNIMRRKK